MLYVKLQNFNPRHLNAIMLRVISICALVIFSSCSQSVDEVTIGGPGHPAAPVVPVTVNRDLLFNSDLTGTSEIIPTSISRIVKDHSMGGTALRTMSTSSSLHMTSGIGIE